MSVAHHRQDHHNVPHDGEHDEERQYHAHRHGPAQIQRGGIVLRAVDGGVGAQGPCVKVRGGGIAPLAHGGDGGVAQLLSIKTQIRTIFILLYVLLLAQYQPPRFAFCQISSL